MQSPLLLPVACLFSETIHLTTRPYTIHQQISGKKQPICMQLAYISIARPEGEHAAQMVQCSLVNV